jgi:hypothetical protein
MDIYEFFEEQENVVFQYVNSRFKQVSADKLGLDIRAGYVLYVSDDAIAVSKRNASNLDYYGGFEYVDKDSRFESCGYVFYTRDSDRVDTCISRYEDEKQVDTETAVS